MIVLSDTLVPSVPSLEIASEVVDVSLTEMVRVVPPPLAAFTASTLYAHESPGSGIVQLIDWEPLEPNDPY